MKTNSTPLHNSDLIESITLHHKMQAALIQAHSTLNENALTTELINKQRESFLKLQELHEAHIHTQYKLLIAKQLILSLQMREKEISTECMEKYNELQEQLKRKEVQYNEREDIFTSAIMLLSKHKHHDKEVDEACTREQQSIHRITSVIAENKMLVKQIEEEAALNKKQQDRIKELAIEKEVLQVNFKSPDITMLSPIIRKRNTIEVSTSAVKIIRRISFSKENESPLV